MRRPADRKNVSRPLSWPLPGFPASAAACLLLCFAYVWLCLEPSVEYGYLGTPFFLSRSFFSQFLALPGGLLDYAAAFLAQLNYYDWLGALVFVALGGLLFLGTRRVCSRMGGIAPLTGGLAPVFLLLWLWGRQDGHALAAGLGVLLGLGLALGYVLVPWRRAWPRVGACWVLSALAVYVGGLWPCLLFLVLGGWFELAVRRKWGPGLGCLLGALAAPLAMIHLAGLPTARVLNRWGTGTPLLLTGALFLCLPLTLLVLALLPKAAAAKEAAGGARRAAAGPVPFGQRLQGPGVKRALAAGLFLAGWAAVLVADHQARWQRALARIEYYASHKEYDKVLAAAAPLKALNPAAEVCLHLALYHTGRLSEDLFAYTNQGAWTLLPGLELGFGACRAQCETLLELGQINEAEHLASEALEIEGRRPDLLRLLAQINILKDHPQAARIFLNLLAQVPFQRAWAAACLRDLEANPRLPDDKELALFRSRMVTTDLPHDELPAEPFLRQLLHSNARNQMAFEYLLAEYLLTRDLEGLVKQLGRLDDFGYQAIPRHVEEAILLRQQLKGAQVELHGRQIRSETVQRFREFTEALNRARNSAEDRAALARDFGGTFWYYFYSRPARSR